MKVPPFGKPLKALLESNRLPNNCIYLYIGEKAWDKGKSSSIARPTKTLILPPKHSPFIYDWPVQGCDILMIETTEMQDYLIEELVDILFSYSATRITLISVNLFLTIYKKDF